MLKIEERTELVSLYKGGWRIPSLAKRFKCSQGWVKYWNSRSKRKIVLTDLPRSGRPSKLKSAKAMKLLQNAEYKRGNSTRTIARRLFKSEIHVSHQTVARSLKARGWKPLRRKRQLLLAKRQRQKRLQFAKDHQNLTEYGWEKFIFSDEASFFLFGRPNPQNDVVWGFQECQVPEAPQIKNSAYVMFWGDISATALTRLHLVPPGKTVTANYYMNTILERNLKHCLNRRRTTGSVTENKMVENVGSLTF